MKYFNIIIVFLFIGGWAIVAKAQDPHFSQFYISPLTLNPALTGLQEGNMRIVGNYRSQWASVSKPYQTASISAEFNILKGRIGNNVMGIGFMLFNDKAGTSALRRTRLATTLGYSQYMGFDGAYLSVGFEGAMEQQSINRNNLLFEKQYDGTLLNDHLSSGELLMNESVWNFAMSAGLAFSFTPDKNQSYYMGLSVAHLARPNRTMLVDRGKDITNMKYTAYIGMEYRLNGYFSVIPRAVFLYQGTSKEINVGGYTKIHLESAWVEEEFSVSLGGMYRFGDAFIPMCRIDYGSFGVGISYDVNISKLSNASSSSGGLEIALLYKGLINDGASSGFSLPCPSF